VTDAFEHRTTAAAVDRRAPIATHQPASQRVAGTDRVREALNDVARGCLVIAIAAVGLKTSPLEMKRVGARAFALLGFEAVFLAGTVLAVQRLIG